MKKWSFILIILIAFGFSVSLIAQSGKTELYNPKKNAILQIDSAILVAAMENKHVLIQVGGNWCSWCILLHKFFSTDPQVDSVLKACYVVEYVNYSKENKNPYLMQNLEFPQRFGFPVLVILDGTGKRLHTQNTAYLEEGKGYNKEKVLEFLKQWSPAAIKPENYEDNN